MMTRRIAKARAPVPVPIPWYLSGGISAADCIFAYLAKGAASYAASKVNLNSPGTYDATEGVAPTWASASGWTYDGTKNLLSGYTIAASGTVVASFVVQYANASGNHIIMGGPSNLSLYSNWFGSVLAQSPTPLGSQQWYGGAPHAAGNLAIVGDKGIYYNGTLLSNARNGGYSGVAGGQVVIGASDFVGDVYAASLYSIELSDSAMAALATAMAAL